jgi:hypothetical protein
LSNKDSSQRKNRLEKICLAQLLSEILDSSATLRMKDYWMPASGKMTEKTGNDIHPSTLDRA